LTDENFFSSLYIVELIAAWAIPAPTKKNPDINNKINVGFKEALIRFPLSKKFIGSII